MDIAKYYDLRKVKGDLGIEVEVEGDGLPHVIDGGLWRVEHDGSLVGESYEYVFRAPLSEDKAMLALIDLGTAFKAKGSKVNDSVRCGVHVHVNVQELTFRQLYTFMTLYAKLEWALLEYCGIGRRGNLFCLPLNNSPLLIHTLRKYAVVEDYMGLYSDEWRYCAMNVKSLRQYGSLEFRAMRGGDLEKTGIWARFLLYLRNVACEIDNPLAVVADDWSPLGIIGAWPEIFGGCINLKNKLKSGENTALAIAHCKLWKDKGDKYEDFY